MEESPMKLFYLVIKLALMNTGVWFIAGSEFESYSETAKAIEPFIGIFAKACASLLSLASVYAIFFKKKEK